MVHILHGLSDIITPIKEHYKPKIYSIQLYNKIRSKIFLGTIDFTSLKQPTNATIKNKIKKNNVCNWNLHYIFINYQK